MTELRKDPLVNRWTIVKQKNTWGPDDYLKEDNDIHIPERSPFQYGREKLTPPEVAVFRDEKSKPNEKGWRVRVVPNKFPALKIEGSLDRETFGLYDKSNGIGAHEVLIETPDPVKQMADFSDEEMLDVMSMYQKRSIDLAGDTRFKYVAIFKNFGESAGASIQHAHSQIIALPMVPKNVQEKIEVAQNYYQYRGRSIFEDILEQEMRDQERIVTENDEFVAFCPFVSRYSFETIIYPKNPLSEFVTLDSDSLLNAGNILRDVLKKMKTTLHNPAYNFYLHVQPVNYGFTETFLWHIEILPKLTSATVFDFGVGFHVVHTPPEKAANYLREAK